MAQLTVTQPAARTGVHRETCASRMEHRARSTQTYEYTDTQRYIQADSHTEI